MNAADCMTLHRMKVASKSETDTQSRIWTIGHSGPADSPRRGAPNDRSFRDFEVVHDFPTLGRRVMLLNARKLWQAGNHSDLILLAIEDVTERKRLEDELVRSNEDMQRFAYVAAHDLRSPLK